MFSYLYNQTLNKILLILGINMVIFIPFFICLLVTIAYATLLERKMLASAQRRRGPNITGIFGLLQPFADGLKLFFKETILLSNSHVLLYFLAPVFTLFCAISLWIIIPLVESGGLIITKNSMIYVLVLSTLSSYGIMFSGWASNSKYAFLGALRSTAQMISYELTMSLIWLCIAMVTDSLNIVDVVEQQGRSVWYIIPLMPLWVIFFIVTLAETNRAPFDLPEAEAELVAGYNVEYSSITFALFFLAEYAAIIVMSSIGVLFFRGGWYPIIPIWLLNYLDYNNVLYILQNTINPLFWFSIKVIMHVSLVIMVRATLPRYRYDQLMKTGWKKLLPITITITLFVSILVLLFL